MLRKGGSNWVEGDRFFDREMEIEALKERVRDGTHTLLTAQRRMGKTSLVRELLRRLAKDGEFETVFVDLEAAIDPADAIAEIGVRSKAAQGIFDRTKAGFLNMVKKSGSWIEELSVADLRVRLRARIDAGNWSQKGDAIFSALAACEKPTVLAIDELPILVNRLLRSGKDRITPEGIQTADAFLGWLRRNSQIHPGRITMILSGSVGLEPLLQQAGLVAHANSFSAYDLKPWSEATADSCLAALAATYAISLPSEIRRNMCRRLRCCIPHHVQMYFDKLHDHLRRSGRLVATLDDVERVYLHEMLGVRGQVGLQHYEGRLEMILGRTGYPIALELLTATAVHGRLNFDSVDRYHEYFSIRKEESAPSVQDVLHVLRHDGYLDWHEDGYGFVSGFLEDWWRRRYGQHFAPILEPGRQVRRNGQ